MAEVGNQNTNQTTITIPGDKGLFGNDKKSRIYTVTDTDTGEITVYDDDKWVMGAGWGDTKIGSYNPKTQQWTFNKDANDAERKYFTSNTGRKIVTNNSQQTLFKSKYDAEIAAGTDPEEARKIANGYSGSVTKEEKAPQVAFALTGIPKQETQRDEMAGKPGQTLIYPQDHAQGDFDFIKIVPIEYIPMLQAGQTFKDAKRALSIKQRYLRKERVVGSTMFLPMVPGISESNATDWAGDTINPIQIAAGQVAAYAISNLGKGAFGEAAQGLMSDTGAAAQSMISDPRTKAFITAYFAGKAVGANLTARAGIVVNPNLEVLFNGPKLRTFQYNFKFTPRDDREAQTVKTIIKVFKKAMAPKRRASMVWLGVPAVFKIKYLMRGKVEHPFLNKIKPCDMTSFNIDYTPEGSYMTYGDGSMTSYAVNMNFAELEPIYNNDVQIDSDDMGY